MDETTFWALIDGARAEMTPELSNQAEILQTKLEQLPPAEVAEFDRIFTRLHHDAYRWDLWAAAYIIEGGCSDDGFHYFRAGLIGLGRDVYYAAVRDPRTLVSQPSRGVDFSNEEMSYAAASAYEAITGRELPDSGLTHPREPAGERFDEATVDQKYPELAAKFGGGGQ
ncbi:MAG: DUF4240 domain-containing protein [Deltaproteobacteria bacterium]|nr:DUF4240 domain-containing protein [Deltaproteobacteria bacterium]